MIKYFLLALFLISPVAHSQKKIDPTPEQIEQAKSLKINYKDDDIIVLNHIEKIVFSISRKANKVVTTHTVNEELMNISSRADIQKYMFYNGESTIDNFEILYRNKKPAYFYIRDEAVSNDDMFHHDARVKYAQIDFPVQGYKYYINTSKKINDIKYFTSLYFTDIYQTLHKKITLVIPDWLSLELIELNFDGYSIKKTEEYNKSLKSTIVTYEVDNIDGRFDEEKTPGPSHIYPHVLVLAKSFTNKNKKHTLFNETQDLYNWYRSLVDEMEEDPNVLKEKVNKLIIDAKTDEDKIKIIYYWVQDNIRYIAFEDGLAGFKPDESQNVFKKRYGDCKGMANLTKQMLKEAGFDARLTWIGTKRIAYDYSTPSLSVDNHMICTLFIEGEQVFLDGTEKFNSYGEYAERIQGKQVLIENGDSYILKTVPESSSRNNLESYLFKAKINDNLLEGEVVKTFRGESRASFLYYFNLLQNDLKEDAINYYLKNDDKNLTVANIVTSDLDNRDNTLSINYSLSQKNAISSFDEEIYVDLDYEKEFGKFIFKDRNTDYLFSFKKEIESTIILEIPSNYIISELPKSIDIDTENYKINIAFAQEENTLIYTKVFIIKNAIIKTEDFNSWNDAIRDLQSIYNEQIILIKKSS